MVKRALAFNRLKGCAPIFFHDAAGILARFRLLAEIAQHRIDRSLKLEVALTNGFLHSFPFPVAAQTLELLVWIEDENRPGKSPRFTGTVCVHPDHIERVTAEAEREMRIVRIGRDLPVPVEMRGVEFVEQAQLFP